MPESASAALDRVVDVAAIAGRGDELVQDVPPAIAASRPSATFSSTRERVQQLRTLEGPPEAAAGTPAGPGARHVVAVQQDPPAGRAHEARAGVERGGLAGAVGADQAGDAAARRLEAQPVDRHAGRRSAR